MSKPFASASLGVLLLAAVARGAPAPSTPPTPGAPALPPPYPKLVFTAPVLPSESCAVNGVYLRDAEANLCCSSGAPRVPIPAGCPTAGQAIVPLSNAIVQFAIAALSANSAISTAASFESRGGGTASQKGLPEPLETKGAPAFDASSFEKVTPLSEKSAAQAGGAEQGVTVLEFKGASSGQGGGKAIGGALATPPQAPAPEGAAGARTVASTPSQPAQKAPETVGAIATKSPPASQGEATADREVGVPGKGGMDAISRDQKSILQEGPTEQELEAMEYFERIQREESLFKVVERRYNTKQHQWGDIDRESLLRRMDRNATTKKIPMH